jgi:hypothetical protein
MMKADASDTAETEADVSIDHTLDQYLGGADSFVEVGADGTGSMPEVEHAGDAHADLPLGTGGTFDTGGTGGTGGSDTSGMPGPDVAAATDGSAASGSGGTFDTGGAGGTIGDGADGMLEPDGASATGGSTTGGSATGGSATGGTFDSGGAGGANVGGAGGVPGLGGATATGGTGGAVSLPAGLVAWWKMDEAAGSSTAVDASGNGNNATLTGLNTASAWTAGRTGGALKCDGSGGALVNDSVSLDGITTGVTISAWVNRLGASTGFTAILSREIGTTITEYYYLGLSGDKAEFYSSSGGLSTTTIPIGIWTHMAVTDDGNTVRLYVNGSQVTSRNASDVFKADTSKLTICGNQNDTSGAITQRWNGLVDDLQLYNRVLAATEIANLAK